MKKAHVRRKQRPPVEEFVWLQLYLADIEPHRWTEVADFLEAYGRLHFHVVSRNEAQPEVKQAILAAARRYDRDTLQPFAAHIQSLGGKASWHDMLYAIETNDTVAARLMMLCEDRAEYAAIRTEMLQRFLTSPSLSQQLIGLIYDGVGNYLETIPER